MRVLLKTIYWLVLAGCLAAGAVGAAYVRRVHQLDALIVHAAEVQQIDPRLAVALVRMRSNLDPSYVAGDRMGLLGLTAEDSRAWSRATGIPGEVFDLFDPRRNLEIGFWKLSLLHASWQGHPEGQRWALVEWHAGHALAREWAERGSTGNPLSDVPDESVRSFIAAVERACRREEVRLAKLLPRP